MITFDKLIPGNLYLYDCASHTGNLLSKFGLHPMVFKYKYENEKTEGTVYVFLNLSLHPGFNQAKMHFRIHHLKWFFDI